MHELISQIPLFWNYENHIHTLIKIVKNVKIILKLEKICEGVCLKEKGNKFIKNGILATLNLKERQKINDLKLFENWNRIKTI